jgi:hypothetical protein
MQLKKNLIVNEKQEDINSKEKGSKEKGNKVS